jgi:type II secretory pathway pseudopilin PulG
MSSKTHLTLSSVGLRRSLELRGQRRPTRGVSLVELLIATTILAMIVVAVFGSLLQSRRLSEGSISQNSAVAIVQGYIEQMKSMEFTDLPYTMSGSTTIVSGASTAVPSGQVPTRLDEKTVDPLVLSTALTFPALSTITLSPQSITNVKDNIKVVDINKTPSTTDDLKLNLRVWVQDISSPSVSATQVRAITIQYAYQVNDGARSRIHRGTVRSIRSVVPTH